MTVTHLFQFISDCGTSVSVYLTEALLGLSVTGDTYERAIQLQFISDFIGTHIRLGVIQMPRLARCCLAFNLRSAILPVFVEDRKLLSGSDVAAAAV